MLARIQANPSFDPTDIWPLAETQAAWNRPAYIDAVNAATQSDIVQGLSIVCLAATFLSIPNFESIFMARVTVEDCIDKIPNRFDLVMMASQRARQLSAGAQPKIERNDDKFPVLALREIAAEAVDMNEVEEAFIKSLQKFVEVEELVDIPDYDAACAPQPYRPDPLLQHRPITGADAAVVRRRCD